MQNHYALVLDLYKIGAIQFGDYTLKSGHKTSIYINLRKIISYPDLLRRVAEAIWNEVKTCQFDHICGVPYAALPIATCVSLDHRIPMVMRRKEQKSYGTKQTIEGEFKQGESALIIEDVVTLGTSIIETGEALTEAGLTCTDVVAFIDREQGGKSLLEKKYRTHFVLSLTHLLDILLESGLLTADEQTTIQQFLKMRSA